LSKVVLDSSALIAFIRREPGAGRVGEVIDRSVISTVSLTEVLTLSLVVADLSRATSALQLLPVEVVEFLREDAFVAAALAAVTRHSGLTLGDRCCLAIGHRLGAPVFTADKRWTGLEVGVTVELIR
jgi:PIN domain nuclease of toxin-antitoxin system